MSHTAGAAACAPAPLGSPHPTPVPPWLPPLGEGAGAQAVLRGSSSQSSALSPLLHRGCQAPCRAWGTIPVLAEPGTPQAATSLTPAHMLERGLTQSPCPYTGVPSHRTGMLCLFEKPGFINTARSYLHFQTPQQGQPVPLQMRCCAMLPQQRTGSREVGTAHVLHSAAEGSWQPTEAGAHHEQPSPGHQAPQQLPCRKELW